jgi:hypothetical protein
MPATFEFFVGGSRNLVTVPDDGSIVWDGFTLRGATADEVGHFVGGSHDSAIWSFDVTETPRLVGGSVEEVDDGERVYSVTTPDTSYADFVFDFVPEGESVLTEELTAELLYTNAGTIEQLDTYRWKFHSNGTASTVRIKSTNGSLVRTLEKSVAAASADPSSTFAGWSVNTTGEALSGYLATKVDGKTLLANGLVYSTQDHSTPAYVRSSSHWAAGLDFTAVSPWNSSSASNLGVVAITPRHVLMAAHAGPSDGATVRFVTAANAVVERTLVRSFAHPDYPTPSSFPGYPTLYPDLRVGVLDSDLPGTITPVKTFDLADLAARVSERGKNLPTVQFDKEEKTLIGTLYQTDAATGSDLVSHVSDLGYEFDDRFNGWYEPLIGGDSGNPVFLMLGATPLLLTVWTYGGSGAGTSVPIFQSDINTLISQLDTSEGISTGYTLEAIASSAWSAYPTL